ncbi:response regulator [Candidatus Trichorickettsia mobilis]|uniref:response regulator n=1 Tax=Candidatus Trichorickettsia mobilis TaxID=1346319 RepID=UPI00292E204E|nr:response regulator [Candidatus Trichorickettsia mobilis]
MNHQSKVLIVEDNELNLKLFHDLLVIQNYEVMTSKNGLGIPDLIENERPDLILMDIQLNGISGIDIIKELKKNPATSSIPIIAITAFAMKNDEAKISASGCDMYLPKPVSIDLFFQALHKFIEPNNKN